MNPDTDEFGLVFSFDDAAFTSRFVHFLVEGDLSSWKNWMVEESRNSELCDIFFGLLEKNRKELLPDTSSIMFPFEIKPKWRSLTKFFDIVHHCRTKKLDYTDELVLIARGLLGLQAASAIAGMNINLLLGQTVSFEELLRMPITTDNALSVAESMIALINSKQVVNPTIELADWFLYLAKEHPSIVRSIVQNTNTDVMGKLLLFPAYCDALSIASQH